MTSTSTTPSSRGRVRWPASGRSPRSQYGVASSGSSIGNSVATPSPGEHSLEGATRGGAHRQRVDPPQLVRERRPRAALDLPRRFARRGAASAARPSANRHGSSRTVDEERRELPDVLVGRTRTAEPDEGIRPALERRPVGSLRGDRAQVRLRRARGSPRAEGRRAGARRAAGSRSATARRRAAHAATCSVVAFWCGASRRASWMSSSEPYHHAVSGWPMSSTPSSSRPSTMSSFMIRWFGLQLVAAHRAARAGWRSPRRPGSTRSARSAGRRPRRSPHGQVVGDRERLAVPDHHADDRRRTAPTSAPTSCSRSARGRSGCAARGRA